MSQSKFWVRSIPHIPVEEQTSDWIIQPLFKDYSGIMGTISTYYSVLKPGCIPHEIHSHAEEEIIVLLSGNLDILSPSSHYQIGSGSFFHHPPGDLHTIQAVGSESATFLVFKWAWESVDQSLIQAKFFCFDANCLTPWDEHKNIQFQQACQSQPLANGGRFVANAFHVAPNTGYPTHSHTHDLIVLLLNGQMSALGHNTSAPAVIYYPAGITHALAPNPDPIDILEFQFHSPHSSEI